MDEERQLVERQRAFDLPFDARDVPSATSGDLDVAYQEARKPMFHLTSADGAIGAHTRAVAGARENFARLAGELLKRCHLPQPASA